MSSYRHVSLDLYDCSLAVYCLFVGNNFWHVSMLPIVLSNHPQHWEKVLSISVNSQTHVGPCIRAVYFVQGAVHDIEKQLRL